jgi:hypothetical protein
MTVRRDIDGTNKGKNINASTNHTIIMTKPSTNILKDAIVKRFAAYRELGEKALRQLDDRQIHWKRSGNDNSICTLVMHLHGNMLSRFTDFQTSDGEKSWRQREAEFNEQDADRERLLLLWNEGWDCVAKALKPLADAEMGRTVTIRGEPHSIADALLRQVAHYAYHVGQIVFIAKTIKGDGWESLSIPKNGSQQYNQAMWQKQNQKQKHDPDHEN